MAKRSEPRQKPRTPGNRKNLALVALAGLLLVVWGFVLGVLVGRGTMPTLIADRTSQPKESKAETQTSRTGKAVSTTETNVTTTTVTTRPETTTTFGFFKKLPENVAETLPPLPPPTTVKRPAPRDKSAKPSSSTKPEVETPKKKKSEPKKEPPAKKAEPVAPVYSLQVAALPTKEEAVAEARRVAKKTELKVRVVTSKVKGKIWHRIRVGGFATKAEARAAARKLDAAGLKSMLVRAAP